MTAQRIQSTPRRCVAIGVLGSAADGLGRCWPRAAAAATPTAPTAAAPTTPRRRGRPTAARRRRADQAPTTAPRRGRSQPRPPAAAPTAAPTAAAAAPRRRRASPRPSSASSRSRPRSIPPPMPPRPSPRSCATTCTRAWCAWTARARSLGSLAKSWDVSPDGTVVTFHLVSGAKWHDGTPFTAQDVKFSWDRAADAGTSPPNPHRDYWAPVKSVDVVDDATVKVTLEHVQRQLAVPHGGRLGVHRVEQVGCDTTRPIRSAPGRSSSAAGIAARAWR